jgi:spermidine synthase
LAAYARDGDFVRFYEINPAVIDLSLRDRAATNSGWFTFVSDARQRGATVEIEVGDARLVLSRESQDGQPNRFDVLAVDAFSGDAIPIHLLTRECFDLYLEHLTADGVLAFHVSNQYLNLAPVVRRLAADRSLLAICVKTLPVKESGNVASTWVLVTRNHAFGKLAATWPEYSPWSSTLDTAPLWTDDFSSIFQVLRL